MSTRRFVAAFLIAALAASPVFADTSIEQAGLAILGMTDDFAGPLATGDFNGDGRVDLAIGATGT